MHALKDTFLRVSLSAVFGGAYGVMIIVLENVLISLFNGILTRCGLFNAKPILIEGH